jgi:hypothetical protein
MLTASINQTTGVIAYSVNQLNGASLSSTSYVSGVAQTIGLLDAAFQEWMTVSRALAVRIALGSGLSQFAQGIKYDATIDKYLPTTDQQLAPMFEAIFRAAPADNTGDAIADYLTLERNTLADLSRLSDQRRRHALGRLHPARSGVPDAAGGGGL